MSNDFGYWVQNLYQVRILVLGTDLRTEIVTSNYFGTRYGFSSRNRTRYGFSYWIRIFVWREWRICDSTNGQCVIRDSTRPCMF